MSLWIVKTSVSILLNFPPFFSAIPSESDIMKYSNDLLHTHICQVTWRQARLERHSDSDSESGATENHMADGTYPTTGPRCGRLRRMLGC